MNVLLGILSYLRLLNFLIARSSLLLRTAQNFPRTLGLEYCVGVANDWINECNSRRSKGCHVPENPPLPSRVLDIGHSPTSSKVKLLVTNGESGQYVCLSYCWGNIKKWNNVEYRQRIFPHQINTFRKAPENFPRRYCSH